MSVSAAEHHREVAGRFSALVAGVGGLWDAPTPVAAWRARDIVAHLVTWFPGFLASGAGVDLPVGPSPDDDPAGAWEAQRAAVQAVLDDPASAGRVLTDPHLGEIPLPDAIDRFYTADVFMHSWDLARATGQDDNLDAGTCAEMLAGMAAFDDALRSSGQYGPRVPVPDDAPVLDRFIGFIGRDPFWRPPA